ncbi:hypothetical protein QAY90_gp50 [Xanthomonas phage Langgrundblatt2]|uniref:Tail protein n=1 Tax=Xanthomonas phage Langgrundblatt2 TaxID=2939129 RepID=A0A9E7J554_9CAUD|nr:hypothetical protein QAY90_gp50 [Xanthomonas phage Langgrundblatt2]URA06881.1 hypothetical protein Langgrundblatt2_BL20050 [Xanthomonas phage Langgrundblatt2]
MIPENRISTTAVVGSFIDSFYLGTPLKSVEWGGVAINDTSQGIQVKPWTIEYDRQTGDVFVTAFGVPKTVLFTRADITEVSLAFDRNMQPVVAFVQAGQAKLYFYDDLLPGFTFWETELGSAKNPRVSHDDKRDAQSDISDVILGYVSGSSLRYRQQRDRYLTERTLIATGVTRLIHVGMNNKLRLQFMYVGLGDAPPFLGDIVSALCTRAGILPINVDVSELYDTQVIGYKCNTDDGVNKRIDALREVFFFDKSETDRKIYFPRRGREAIVRIPYVDLVADDPSALKETRIQEIELPKAVTVNHLDPAGGFATNKQTARRRSNLIKATKELKLESEVVLTADQGMTAATVKLKIAWHEQQTYKFATWLKYAQVVPTDVIEVEDKVGNWHRIRITERNDDHPLIKFEAVADAGQDVYATLGIGHSLPPPTSTTPGLIGESLLEILNIPTLRDQDDELGVYIAVCGQTSAWYGAQILVSTDGGANFFEAMQIETPATIGETLTDLEEEISAQYPSNQSFEVLVNFPLESLTRENLLKNGNRCVIGDELLQFQFAVLLGMVGDKYHYRLSGLVRGRKATDVEFWPTGTRFVVLDSSIAFLQAQQWMLGKEIQIKPVSLGLTEDETVATAYDYLEGVSQREFPVHHVTATRDGSNNVTVNFIGRGRLGIETAPRNGKYFAGYRIKFSNGHTIDTLTMTGTYNSAPGGLTVQVCALNTVTGEGPYSPAVST